MPNTPHIPQNHWLAESGSTKTDWVCYQGPAEGTRFLTAGINPSYSPAEQLPAALARALAAQPLALGSVASFTWYGAGCDAPTPRQRMHAALQGLLPQAHIAVQHDLLAAARACLGHAPGLVAILGTGSHACFFDGAAIATQAVNLGYLLGDEGSGAAMGKRLLQAFFYKQLPADEHQYLADALALTREAALAQLYSQPAPNTWLASLAVHVAARPFLRHHIALPALQQFVETHLLPLEAQTGNMHVAAVGSIASHFRPELALACSHKLLLGSILANPTDALVAYHQKQGFLV